MSWLGQNGASREDFYALSDAYKAMYMQQELNEDPEQLEEKEGKKDACYNKVKSRYSVWPSAYASGALVKCRQKGAKNWGNSSKKEAFDLAVGEMMAEGIDLSDTYEEDAFDAFLFGWDEQELQEGNYDKKNTRHLNPNVKAKPSMDPDSNLNKMESEVLSALSDAYSMMYEKKKDSDKCGDGTYWDKEEKKCKSKKKKSGTTVVVGRGGIYGPGYHGGGGGSNGDGDGDGGDTDGGGGDGGGGE